MLATLLEQPRRPLRERWIAVPQPRADQVLIRVGACGVCRTDLHIVDGELPPHKLPLIPGHEVAGAVVKVPRANRYEVAAWEDMLKVEDDALFHGCMMGKQVIVTIKMIAAIRALTCTESGDSESIAVADTALGTEAWHC